MTGATDDRGFGADDGATSGASAKPDDQLHRTLISTTPGDVPERAGSTYAATLAARNRRKRVVGTLLGVLVVGAVVGGVIAFDAGDESGSESRDTVAASTTDAPVPTRPPGIGLPAQVVLGDLQPLVATADGVVSSIGEVGDIVERGGVLALVDTLPVVVFYGDEPFARELRVGSSGTDVRQLEANLAALGFDDGGAMTVDLDYTSATATAVAAWEDSIGIARSGVVPAGRLTHASGPVRLAETAAPGTPVAAGEPLARVILLRRVVDLVQNGSGLLTAPLQPGAAVRHGDTLHLLGDLPVLAVTERSDFLSSVLDPLAAGDIAGVESALVFFGYDPDGVIVVDATADLATLAAFARWQTAMGLPETLAVGGEYYIAAPAGSTVCRTYVAEGQAIENGALAYTVESPTVIVTARVPVEQEERFAVGEVVMVEVTDRFVVSAMVVRTGDAAEAEAETAGAAGEAAATTGDTTDAGDAGDAGDAADTAADTSGVAVTLVVLDALPTVLGGPATLLPEAETGAQEAPEDVAAEEAPASCSVVDS